MQAFTNLDMMEIIVEQEENKENSQNRHHIFQPKTGEKEKVSSIFSTQPANQPSTQPNNQPASKPTTSGKEKYAEVIHDFTSQRENDIALKKGQKVKVLQMKDNGWWIGICEGKIGFFPYNYVQV